MAKFGEKMGVKAPSQRQLQVGEEIRHILSSIFMRGELHNPELSSTSITVSEVRISPDLKNATAYVLPLAGKDKEMIVSILSSNANFLRHLVGKSIRLRQVPKLSFKLDNSYENAGRINELLSHPTVARDLAANDAAAEAE